MYLKTWGGKITYINIDEFNFPESHYSMIFSEQVIEHVHNVGNYLCRINNMLKLGGYLLIGTTNICNPRFNLDTILFSDERAKKISEDILDHYNKAQTHINSWDPSHFVQLMASVGFLFETWEPMEGVPHSFKLKKIPLLGNIFPLYTNKSNKTIWGRRCYTMQFLFKKVKNIKISQFD